MKKILFVCSQNKLRSPTAEAVFSNIEGLEVDSAGTEISANNPISMDAIEWADIIFVMESNHKIKINKKFKSHLKNKRIICLDIPDKYEYMDEELINILKKKVGTVLGIRFE